MRRLAIVFAAVCAFMAAPVAAERSEAFSGRVVDAVTGHPIKGANIVSGSAAAASGEDGAFTIEPQGAISVRASGYLRAERADSTLDASVDVMLAPVVPKAVFVYMPALDRPNLLDALVALHTKTPINALVIDVKNTHGEIALSGSLHDEIQNADRLRARTAAVGKLLASIHGNGMYAIARIVTFEDALLVRAAPQLALHKKDGGLVRGIDGMAWTDPRNDAVRAYVLSVASAAARAGFDEIQFDYVRFPTVGGKTAAVAGLSSDERRKTIVSFLHEAKLALAPANVFLSADLFGYTSWDSGDLNIGQNIGDEAAEIDYICPMLYPSLFRHGIPSVHAPLAQPFKIVALSLQHAQRSFGIPPGRFRPWLQGFRGRRMLGRSKILSQVRAAEAFGANGWMLWHPQSLYSVAELTECSRRKCPRE